MTAVIDLPAFGKTGPYVKIAGTFEGEVDPADARNAVIADIDLLHPRAGRSEQGERHGYIVAFSGWAGDVAPGENVLSIEVPVVTNPDGSPITGLVVAELIPDEPDETTINLPYPASGTSPTNGTLTVREHEADPKVPLTGWTYENDRRITIPGPAKPQWIYEFVYEARDPKLMGLGHAATRDFLSFLKHGTVDDDGNPNPAAVPGGVTAIYSWGRSQGGRVERDFLGMMPYATGAAGLMWMNYRFAQPTVSAQQHSRHHSHEPEFPHTFPVMTDPLTGQTGGILERCLESDTCPKFFNIDGGTGPSSARSPSRWTGG